jgi:hypothetical protein
MKSIIFLLGVCTFFCVAYASPASFQSNNEKATDQGLFWRRYLENSNAVAQAVDRAIMQAVDRAVMESLNEKARD